MGYDEVVVVDAHSVVEQDVDVDDAVVILAVDRLLCASHLALYVLGCLQKLMWRQRGEHLHATVQKLVGRGKAPRLGLYERRLALYASHLFANHADSIMEQALAVAKIGS